MNTVAEVKDVLESLFSAQQLAVLSTQGEGQPYASLVAFAATEDLRHLLFATARATRKYNNLSSHSRVALLIDSRTNDYKDFSQAVAVTALGRAFETDGAEHRSLMDLYLNKHPYMQDFVSAPSCALLKVVVDCYYVVSRFQNVVELHVEPWSLSSH